MLSPNSVCSTLAQCLTPTEDRVRCLLMSDWIHEWTSKEYVGKVRGHSRLLLTEGLPRLEALTVPHVGSHVCLGQRTRAWGKGESGGSHRLGLSRLDVRKDSGTRQLWETVREREKLDHVCISIRKLSSWGEKAHSSEGAGGTDTRSERKLAHQGSQVRQFLVITKPSAQT